MKSTKILTIILMATIALSILSPLPVTAQSDEPLFKMTLTAPTGANQLRRQWALIVANSLKSVGIDTRVVFLGWDGIFDRVLTPPADLIGKLWDEGGYDALFVGYTPGSPSTPFQGTRQNYHSTNTPPSDNYILWNNSVSDTLIDGMVTTGYTEEGIELFKDWQELQFEEIPVSQIFYTTAVTAADKDLDFHDSMWLFDNLGPEPELLSGMSEVVLASTGLLLDLCAPKSNSWYDTIVYYPIYDDLYMPDATLEYVPKLATSYTVSEDGYTFTYNLRSGVKWHDGHEFDADDVLFSYLSYLMPAIGSQFVGIIGGYVGEDITFKWLNGTDTRLALDLTLGDYWYPAPANVTRTREATIEAVDKYTVAFTLSDMGDLGKPAATFHPEGFVAQMIPKHVLEPIPWEDWDAHPYNTGTGSYESNGQTFTGPIGTGAYVFKEYDPVKQLITLEKFDDYFEKDELEAKGQFEVEKFYVRYIVEKAAAVAALKNEEVHVIDQNYFLQSDYVAGLLDFANAYPLEGSGIQQLGFNLRHPVYGTGVDTPLGQADPSQAANAAKYVRQAIDYLIPRELIVDNLMSGLGTAYGVHVNVVSPYAVPGLVRDYNPTKAKELLAMAGYDVGVTPTGPSALEDYLLGETVTFSGTFPIEDVVESIDQGGLVVLLDMSPDNMTWTPVAQGITTTGGYYSLSYTPESTGDYFFRVNLTGAGAASAAASAATGPDFPYVGITQSVTPQTTPVVEVSVISVAQSTSALTSEVDSLTSEVSTLSSQLSSLRTIAYVGIVLALLAIAVAYFLGSRK